MWNYMYMYHEICVLLTNEILHHIPSSWISHVVKGRQYSVNTVNPICTKGSGFPYILLTAQEVRVYLVAMIALRHALARERKTYAC